MLPPDRPLAGRVALVAGATRGCGRAIAVEPGALGATVYGSGRSTRAGRSPIDRPETIEETAERVTAAGGHGVAVRCDHADSDDVGALVDRIRRDHGRPDILASWSRWATASATCRIARRCRTTSSRPRSSAWARRSRTTSGRTPSRP